MDQREKLMELKEESGFNWKEFSAYFEIPYRTVQDWGHGKRKMPPYVLHLMEYKLRMDKMFSEENKNG